MVEALSDDGFEAAEQRGRREIALQPRATSAWYDPETDRIVIDLANGCTLLIPPSILQDLQDAASDEVADIQVSPTGLALYWPKIDVDFSVSGLMAGVFGTAKFMEAQRRGGQSRSVAKSMAARRNGRKGGRPRKSA